MQHYRNAGTATLQGNTVRFDYVILLEAETSEAEIKVIRTKLHKNHQNQTASKVIRIKLHQSNRKSSEPNCIKSHQN